MRGIASAARAPEAGLKAEMPETGKEARGRHASSLGPLFGWHDLKVVVDGEGSGHSFGANAGQILVSLVVDDAFERHVPILDNDSYRLLHAKRILFESGLSVDGAEQTETDLVVHRRWRKDLDLVVDPINAFDVFDRTLGVRFQNWSDDLAHQSHGAAVDFVSNVVE